MRKLFCYGKQDYCDQAICSGACEFHDGSGSEYRKIDTIGDNIRAMFATDEGIAEVILALDITLADDGKEFTMYYCDGKNNCIDEDGNITCTDEMRKACIVRWFRRPVEGTKPTMTEEMQDSGLVEEE